MRPFAPVIAVVLLAAGLAAPAQGKVAIAAFGLWDDQNVFSLEASRGAAILARDLGPGARSVVRTNSRSSARATPAAMAAGLLQAAAGLDRERDVLVLLLTSHGAPEGIALKIGRRTGLLPPQYIGEMLKATGVKHRVLIVSACYSGIFADALADANTLVITAADADHPSFGCTATAQWTYFGEAFFAHALRRTRALPEAFAVARREVAARERAEKFDPSNPQMRGGEAVLPLLDAR